MTDINKQKKELRENLGDFPLDEQKSKVQTMFQELEILSLQKGNRNSLDIGKLTEKQIDKLLDSMALNETNSFAYHTRRIEAIKEIEISKIKASVVNQKTQRFILLGSILIIIPAITFCILFFKDKYFLTWLTFLTGTLGGFGLSKLTQNIFKEQSNKSSLHEIDESE